jgi:hypothetical protein
MKGSSGNPAGKPAGILNRATRTAALLLLFRRDEGLFNCHAKST